MTDACCRPRFPPEPLHRRRVARTSVNHLERDETFEAIVARGIDGPHAAGTELLDDAVVANPVGQGGVAHLNAGVFPVPAKQWRCR